MQSSQGKTKETGSGGQVNGGWKKLGRDREIQPMGCHRCGPERGENAARAAVRWVQGGRARVVMESSCPGVLRVSEGGMGSPLSTFLRPPGFQARAEDCRSSWAENSQSHGEVSCTADQLTVIPLFVILSGKT